MKLTDEQEEAIRDYVDRQELKLKTLRDDIIDHLCCVLESELGKGKKPFNQLLQEAMADLAPNGLLDLERKTFFLLNAKRIIMMKKLMLILSCLITMAMAMGFTAKLMHWPGAGELLTASNVLVFILIPLFAFDRYKVAIVRSMSERLTVIFGAGAILLYFLGGFAKFMHWPGAGVLLGLGTLAFIVAFPILFFTIYRKSIS